MMVPSSENGAGHFSAHTTTDPAVAAEEQEIVSRRRRRRRQQQCRSNTIASPDVAAPTLVTRLWMLLVQMRLLLLLCHKTDHGGCFVANAWRTASITSSKNKITRSTASSSTVMLLYPKDTSNKESSGSTTNSTKLFYQNANDDDIAKAFSYNQVSNTTSTNNSISNNNNGTTPLFARGGGGGTLGDIMSSLITRNDDDDAEGMMLLLRDGLVTKESQSLARAFHIHNPLDRMAVTANGNLQRLFSSYYDAPVMVVVQYCNRRRNNELLLGQRQQAKDEASSSPTRAAAAIWERRVLLQLSGDFNDNDQPQTLCTADSTVVVHNQEVEELIESGTVGIGQLFRHFNVLPEFTLLAAGPSYKDGGFWRNYTLTSDKLVTCYIHEEFCENVWNLKKHNNNKEE